MHVSVRLLFKYKGKMRTMTLCRT